MDAPTKSPYGDIGAMMEAQFAMMYPLKDSSIRMHARSVRARGTKGIKLSKVACLWLSRKVIHVG